MTVEIVYVLCGLTSLLCALLLFRQHRTTPSDLLFWSAWCFVCLTGANILLFIDIVLLPKTDLSLWRSGLTLTGFAMLLYGLIHERT